MTVKRIKTTAVNCLKTISHSLLLNFQSIANLNAYPRFLVFYTTFRCDSRCKACNVWKGIDTEKQKEELSIEQIDHIFSDPLFSKLDHINIQGGEPTLRNDLPDIVEVIIKRAPLLKRVGMPTNGLDTEKVKAQATKIYEICRQHNIAFSVGISIDGVGKYHDFARGENAFKRVTKTIEALSPLQQLPGFHLGTNCVLTAKNIENLDKIITFQKEVFNTFNITVVEFREHFLNEKDSAEAKMLLFTENPKEKDILVSYLKKHNYPQNFSDFITFRHEQLRAMLEDNAPRTQSCQYKINGLVLDHRGKLMLCPIGGHLGSCLSESPNRIYFSSNTKKIRREMSNSKCKSCYPYNFYKNERTKDLVKYILFFITSRLKKR
ncbi:MAG: radical SAM protein [Desulfobulbaceae bacterium]|nr:radical SAM protein [Desulfobulbaceae bacterium]